MASPVEAPEQGPGGRGAGGGQAGGRGGHNLKLLPAITLGPRRQWSDGRRVASRAACALPSSLLDLLSGETAGDCLRRGHCAAARRRPSEIRPVSRCLAHERPTLRAARLEALELPLERPLRAGRLFLLGGVLRGLTGAALSPDRAEKVSSGRPVAPVCTFSRFGRPARRATKAASRAGRRLLRGRATGALPPPGRPAARRRPPAPGPGAGRTGRATMGRPPGRPRPPRAEGRARRASGANGMRHTGLGPREATRSWPRHWEPSSHAPPSEWLAGR